MSRPDTSRGNGKVTSPSPGADDTDLEAALRSLGEDVLGEPVPETLLEVLRNSEPAGATRRDDAGRPADELEDSEGVLATDEPDEKDRQDR